jgi:hypothetical protein
MDEEEKERERQRAVDERLGFMDHRRVLGAVCLRARRA